METGIIYNGDCAVVMEGIDDSSVDLIVTSPPYDDAKGKVRARDYKGYTFDFPTIAAQCYRVLKPGGVLVWVVGDTIDPATKGETMISYRHAIHFVDVVGFILHQTIVWNKNTTVFPDRRRYTRSHEHIFVLAKGLPKTVHLQTRPNKWAGDKRSADSTVTKMNKDGTRERRKRKQVKAQGVFTSIQEFGVGMGKTSHDPDVFKFPAPYPEKLAERAILSWSNPGDLILDPFMGSGTTAVAARRLNRQWVGIEISAEYIEQAESRLAKPFTLSLIDAAPQTDSAGDTFNLPLF